MIRLVLFSDQRIARRKEGVLDQIVIHVLKLMQGFDYERDRAKHISDIAGWGLDIVHESYRDKTSSGVAGVGLEYYKNRCNSKFLQEVNKLFKSDYGLKQSLMLSDLEEAFKISIGLLSEKNRSNIVGYLERIFPPKGYIL